MTRDELLLILGAFRQPEMDGIARESWQSEGSTYLRERLTIVAERCCHDFPGDLVEIGCLNGSMTVRLAEVARLYGRRVIAIDPWQVGTQNCEGSEYARFCETIAPYRDSVDVLRMDSRSPEAIAFIKARSLCFAFVDGLHTFDACLSDIRACYHSKLIAVDDIHWSEECMRAFLDGAGVRLRVDLPYLHEGWIL